MHARACLLTVKHLVNGPRVSLLFMKVVVRDDFEVIHPIVPPGVLPLELAKTFTVCLG